MGDDIVADIRTAIRVRCSGMLIFCEEPRAPRTICAHIKNKLPGHKVVIVELRSDHINQEEGALISKALMDGHLLLLIASETRVLPARLMHAWTKYMEHPRNSRVSAGRFIRFEPTDGSRPLGMLNLLLPRGYTGEQPDATLVRWVNATDMKGSPEQPLSEIHVMGRVAVEVSMKSLCFLHHRDHPDARHHHGSVAAIMSGGDKPVTWTDLQRLLRSQADPSMLDILQRFAKSGRLTSEQLDLAAEAVTFLRDLDPDQRIGGSALLPSIYHVLWDWTRFEDEGLIFRGQRNSR
jgi:hypothetical protein